MSHIVVIKTEVREVAAINAACARLQLAPPAEGIVELFSGQAKGIVVQLPNWVYPVVCNVASGELKYDNFEGRWGDHKELDRFLQAYAIERTKLEARKKGHTISEQTLADGSIKLTVQVAGGAI